LLQDFHIVAEEPQNVPDELTIGDAEIDSLKQHLIDDMDAFAAIYQRREGHALKDREKCAKKFRPVWTEYINGSKNAEKYDPEYPSPDVWPGVFQEWLRELYPPDKSVWKYEQYRIDCMLRIGRDRKTGDYKILVAFQQENDPSEIILHTREMYDYSIPEKVVLIWSDDKQTIKQVAEKARQVPGLAAARGVKNAGNIHVLIANREIRDFWLERHPDLPVDLFEYVFIRSDIDQPSNSTNVG